MLDFIIVCFSILTWVLELSWVKGKSDQMAFIRGFRAFRALRPLRVVSKNEGIKTVVNSLLQSIPSLLNVMLIILLFLLVFGILGVQLLQGRFGMCNDDAPTIKFKKDCVGKYNVTLYDSVGRKIGTKQEDRVWSVPIPNNFNNIFYSMITFFEISTLEMWPDVMFNAINSVGKDQVMQRDHNRWMSLIFIIYIFLTTFFIMNLFISVIVDKFIGEIKKRQGAHNFTEEQKEWVKI